MPNEALHWKNKYLELLDQQDAQEANFAKQTELLKRALIRSSLAAEGNDQQLDQQLQTLRTLLRNDIHANQLENHIEQLEDAILKSENKLQQRKDALSITLSNFVQQLQQLQPPKDIQKALRAFEKDLPKQLAQPYTVYNLLGQLQSLQERTLATTLRQGEDVLHSTQAQGLFARLFKTSGVQAQSTVGPDHTLAASTESIEHTDTDLVDSTQAHSSSTAEQTEHGDDNYALPLLLDASYSSVAQHIHDTLTTLLNELPITQHYETQVTELRTRLSSGLNWYELAPLLDELSTIILAITNGADNELTHYLLELNQRLTSFHHSLSSTSDGYAESIKDAKALDNHLRQHVTNFHEDVHTTNDLSHLKQLIDTRLDSFSSTLQVYQEKRTHSETVILERLHALSEHSKNMEQEAQQLSTKLEEQRKQALLDPLTGLANRTAWNERSELEYARIQRNNSSLLLSIIDIDFFKRINDSYGHLAGDKVLRIIANELKKRLRKTDFIARFGGEEYALLLPDTPLAEGAKLLDTLRLSIEACPFHFKGEPVTITFSAGIGKITTDESMDDAFERVDQALYAAKAAGRNRVQTAT
ncbi:MAG TPA: GGDEF domain-containing protein [Thiopseudomonas sp.]|nr:GGDEF domain-containing protein [Thiopseudomonas sp.]